MDFIDNLSSKSKLVFKIHNSISDAKLWSYLYSQCMESNIQINEGMSFSKLKHKISNVMLMKRNVAQLILAEEIKKHNVRLTQIESTLKQNQVTQVSVITKRQGQSQMMPDINDPELDYQSKHLLKIAKTFPKFDKCRTLIDNSHTFEANFSKFDLSEGQRNILFKSWVPVSLASKLPFFSSPEGQECNEFDRDDVITFAAMFEKAYRLVMELNDVDQPTPQSMIYEFVKEWTFLHPVSIVCASSYNSFQEAVVYVEKYRLAFLSQSSESPDTHIVSPIGTDLKIKILPKVNEKYLPYLRARLLTSSEGFEYEKLRILKYFFGYFDHRIGYYDLRLRT
ncbi:hypothetical protein XELAEV_18016088mg [Xenopus laevis]|uniref:Uncharacterized protein n=1 Tax=Xenopus laevis TaxID=8355 RepID=A0A974DJW9_XENLA|nr:hypothetical protein XELAEV_18016088mg [Xenopus laevis]